MIDVTGRMVFHPFRATGPAMSFPEMGSRPMKLQAGSWMRRMSNSRLKLFKSCRVTCFFRWTFSWAILIGWVTILGYSVMLEGRCRGGRQCWDGGVGGV